jgi:hypothetical protein
VFEKLVTDDLEYIALKFYFVHKFLVPLVHLNFCFFTHEELCEWFDKLKSIRIVTLKFIGGALVDTFFKNFITNKSKEPVLEGMVDYIDYAFSGYGEETIF